MSYSPTRLFKRYFSTPEDRAININSYIYYFDRIMKGLKWANQVNYFIRSRDFSKADYCHTFTREQHFATMRYLKQEYPELFI